MGEVDRTVGAPPGVDRNLLTGALVAIPTQYTIHATAATLTTLAILAASLRRRPRTKEAKMRWTVRAD
jgi:hypothetical protein